MAPRRPLRATALAASIALPTGLATGVGFTVTATAEAATTTEARTQPRSVAEWREPLALPAFEGPLVVRPAPGQGLALSPAPGAAPTIFVPAVNDLGSPLVLLAIARDGEWLQVLTPARPNDDTAWVHRADVSTSVPAHRVEISRAALELRVIRNDDDAVLLTSVIGIGKPSTPTPAGQFFVRDHFPTGSMNHPYGPFAFGLSGHSETLLQFGTGDGRLAIHGTNQPASIGTAISNGCPRVPNDVVLALLDYLPLGTPVTIT
jgi:lipoprotein-anchoring transpeptidase ErfK/SrfK